MILQVDVQEIKPGTAVVNFTGALTLGTSLHAADMKLQETLEAGSSKLVLNMAAVPYVDSAGLGTLIHVAGAARERGGELRLCGVAARVADLLRLTRTESILPADADVEASLAALS